MQTFMPIFAHQKLEATLIQNEEICSLEKYFLITIEFFLQTTDRYFDLQKFTQLTISVKYKM